jgi:hypothetical protein
MLAEAWAGENLGRVAQVKVVRDRTWARTSRLETADGVVWLKECAPTHRFEAELVPLLAARRPDLLPRVLAHDTARGWLLLADAGRSFEQLGNAPELWLRLLPRYAELQRDAPELASLPDRTLGRWPELYDELAASELPLEPAEVERLRAHAPRFAELCSELADWGLPATVQHDDLHHKNAFVDGDCLRIIDWGDACRSHPFVSLVVTYRFLDERSEFTRLRDAYLEPWGSGLSTAFDLSQRLGRFAHAFGWVALRRQLPEETRAAYDVPFAVVLRHALVGA